MASASAAARPTPRSSRGQRFYSEASHGVTRAVGAVRNRRAHAIRLGIGRPEPSPDGIQQVGLLGGENAMRALRLGKSTCGGSRGRVGATGTTRAMPQATADVDSRCPPVLPVRQQATVERADASRGRRQIHGRTRRLGPLL